MNIEQVLRANLDTATVLVKDLMVELRSARVAALREFADYMENAIPPHYSERSDYVQGCVHETKRIIMRLRARADEFEREGRAP